MTNEELARMPYFVKACAAVGVEPTPRQAAKFQSGRGKVVEYFKETLDFNAKHLKAPPKKPRKLYVFVIDGITPKFKGTIGGKQ